ncbi:MAG TPA: hypothetical protein VFY90_11905 [Tepidiformaceae bacterium]|nr:hypothetical protein [Candidatus Eisenbacteria bacterium]HEX6032124.1 hypothetical protein [Tepidiformaceae bacterium]
MSARLQRRNVRKGWLALWFFALLLVAQTALPGCSDDDPPTKPQPSGSWQDLGLVATFADAEQLTTWNGLLVAGGLFYRFQGGQDASLLTWDGTTWNRLEPIGSGINALAVYDGKLIVGSAAFRQVSGDTLPTIASWDGSQWTPFDSGLSRRSVTALALFEGDLVAGVSAGNDVYYVARWNGTSWQSVGGTMNGFISALTVYQGLLIAGGGFDTADGVPANHIAAWNGTTWAPLGSGIAGGLNSTGSVLALTADATTLVAGGEFLSAGGVPAVNVARWNGTTWSPLG